MSRASRSTPPAAPEGALLRRALGLTVRRILEVAEGCPEKIRPFLEKIAEHFHDSSYLMFQIRREAEATEWHGKLLARELGLSGAELRDFCRLELTLWLLRETSLPVEKIALLVGFTHGRGLRKLFSRLCGMTPAQARRYLRLVAREHRGFGDEALSWSLRVRFHRGEVETADLAAVLAYLEGRFGPL